MAGIIFRVFGVLFVTVKVLIVTGAIGAVLLAAQERAFNSKKRGLISLRGINNQLFYSPSPARTARISKTRHISKPIPRSLLKDR